MTIGDRIKYKRKELGLSVDDVAKKLGKNRATIYRYESDDIENLPITILEPLAKVLQTTPAELMGWTLNEINYNQDEIQKIKLIDEFDKLNSSGKNEAVNRVSELTYIPQYIDTNVVTIKKKSSKYIPTEEDIRSLVARNGRKLTREEAIDIISTLFTEDEE